MGGTLKDVVVGAAKVVGPPVIAGATGGLGVGLLSAGVKVVGSARSAPASQPLQQVVYPVTASNNAGGFLSGVPRWAIYAAAGVVGLSLLSRRR